MNSSMAYILRSHYLRPWEGVSDTTSYLLSSPLWYLGFSCNLKLSMHLWMYENMYRNLHRRHVPLVFWWRCHLTYESGGQEQPLPVEAWFFLVGMTNRKRLFCKPSFLPLRVAKIASSPRTVQCWVSLLNDSLLVSARNEVKSVTAAFCDAWLHIPLMGLRGHQFKPLEYPEECCLWWTSSVFPAQWFPKTL